MKELDVIHPAAKMCVMAAQQQEQEVCIVVFCCFWVLTPLKVGDATNLVVVLTGEFLGKCEDLLQLGLHPSDIISGYEKGGKKAQEILESMQNRTQLFG